VCHDPVITLKIYRSGLKLGFHDAEGFFDLPAVMVDLCYIGRVIIKICTYCIEAIIFRFLCDDIFV
jgi:hypothetical protein